MRRMLLLALMLLLPAMGCAQAGEGLKVVATNFPCYDLARQAAGERAGVTMLIRPGVEVHSFEPSPEDILAIAGADLFVYIGGESDAWADDLLESLDGPDAPACLRMMDAVQPLLEEGGAGGAPEYDEHIWTSPKNALAMLEAVSDAMGALDPDGADAYAANAAAYVAQISRIDEQIADIVEHGARRELVFADRFPFLYFVRQYDLDWLAAFPSCTAETEPTPQTMLTLIQRVQNDGIPAVYTIELSTQAVARTVAEETGARILTMHSMQTVTQAQFDGGESWVSLMRGNVEALREGLS